MSPRGARPPSAGSGARRRDDAISPVIGMVLILAISVLGIVAVSNWGLPAITQMRTNAEVRGVLDEFSALDASMQKLVSSTAGQTTVKWQPLINEGSVDVHPKGERYLLAADVVSWVQVEWSQASDTDNAFALTTNATINDFRLKAWLWDGGASTELRVSASSGSCTALPLANRAAGPVTYYLVTNSSSCSNINLDNRVVSFQVLGYEPTKPVAANSLHRAFLMDVGHLHWQSHSGPNDPRHVYLANGAVFTGPANDLLLQSALPIAPPRSFTNATGVDSLGFFARFVKVNGSASFSAVPGAGERYSLFLNLVGTYTMGSEANVTTVYAYVWGQQRAPVYDRLQDAVAGYKFQQRIANGETFLYHKEGTKPFDFSVVYSLVKVEG